MRTIDIEFVHSIMKHPDVYPFITDDGSPSVDDFDASEMVENDLFYFISPNEYTVFANMPVNTITWCIHTCILKPGRGLTAVGAAKDMLRYMFTATPCEKLISWVPEPYKHVLRFALTCGMVKEGVSRSSFLKNGRAYDLTLIGLTRKEWSCQQ